MSTKSNYELGKSSNTDDINEFLNRNPVLGAVPINSQQSWQSQFQQRQKNEPQKLGPGSGINDFLTQGQIRSGGASQELGKPGVMGAKPGTDIRSPADKGEIAPGNPMSSGPTAGISGGMTDESDWRAVFGAKKPAGFLAGNFGGVSSLTNRGYGNNISSSISSIYGTGSSTGTKLKLGMNSVQAGQQYAQNLLDNLANGS